MISARGVDRLLRLWRGSTGAFFQITLPGRIANGVS